VPTLAPKGGVSAGYYSSHPLPSGQSRAESNLNRFEGKDESCDATGGFGRPTSKIGWGGDEDEKAIPGLSASSRGSQESPLPPPSVSNSSRKSSADGYVSLELSKRTTLNDEQRGAIRNKHNFSSNEAQDHMKPRANTPSLGVDLTFATETNFNSPPRPSSPPPQPQQKPDDQVQFMSRLARERAEKRRLEERKRAEEQRERTARRLQELDSKARSASSPPPNKNNSNKNGDIVLERLGRPKPNATTKSNLTNGPSQNKNDQPSAPPPLSKALIDPTRSFSSLVGGSRNTSPPAPPFNVPATPPTAAADRSSPPLPVIHLSSYDASDRGESKQQRTRMLFDPKSGSMIEAPPAIEKPAPKPRKVKQRSAPAQQQQQQTAVTVVRRDTKKKKDLPRTRGVLYKKTGEGRYVSADGCDADDGYGAHSVPGGRVRNVNAYKDYLHHQKQQKREVDKATTVKKKNEKKKSKGGTNTTAIAAEKPVPPTSLALASKNELLPLPIPQEWSSLPAPTMKPNERMDILATAQDNPELQATANPWAPSEAALAAVAAAQRDEDIGGLEEGIVRGVISDDSEEEDDEELDLAMGFRSSPSNIGLGFDPTENMDAVIKSPSLHSTADNDDDRLLSSLSLGPTVAAPSSPTTFAPLGTPGRYLSSTWSTTTNGLSGDIVSPPVFGAVNWSMTERATIAPASTFLSLSPLTDGQNTWSVGDLGGLTKKTNGQSAE